MKRIITLVALVFIAIMSMSQLTLAQNEIWTFTGDPELAQTESTRASNFGVTLTDFRTVQANLPALEAVLQSAPLEFSGGDATILTLPMPDGTFQRFTLMEAPVMEPELAAALPDVKTYVIYGIDDPTATGSVSYTPLGFQAFVIGPTGTVVVAQTDTGSMTEFIVYDGANMEDTLGFFEFPPVEIPGDEVNISATGTFTTPTLRRQLRLALATTGEFTQAEGGVVATQALLPTIVNQVNAFYRREVNIEFVLVGNNNALVFPDPNTDPFSPLGNNVSTVFAQNATTINNTIGVGNYDVGHLLGTGAGGVATLSSACNINFKANGLSFFGYNNTFPTIFLNGFGHELGHQLSANHTWNSCPENAGQRQAQSAYEPGGGTSIMSYESICDTDNNITTFTGTYELYFHADSIERMNSFLGGQSCGTLMGAVNNPPVVNAGTGGVTLPANTKFTLTGSATDANSDPLTYSWEQYDLNPNPYPPAQAATQTSGPLFRVFSPEASNSRTFPRQTAYPNDIPEKSEVLPAVSRPMNFVLVARDGKGGVAADTLSVNVEGSAGPFTVNAPANGSIQEGATTVTWNVANTNTAPVSCAAVKILLSTDGGATYAQTLTASTPNDGNHTVTLPDITTNTARIRVQCDLNGTVSFFDTSDANFRVVPSNLDYDVNNDGRISPTDLIIVVNDLGQTGGSSDIDQNGTVAEFDAQLVLAKLGDTP